MTGLFELTLFNNRGRSVVSMMAVFAVALATLAIVVVSATATSASCNADRQKDEVWGPDTYRAKAFCDQIGSGTKVRAKLQRDGGVDWHSDWFTRTYTSNYTGWATCPLGCRALYDPAPR